MRIAMPKIIGRVKLVEHPHPSNGHFVVVENSQGLRHYVSALCGAAARGLPVGAPLMLGRSANKDFSAYTLDRVK